MRVGFYASLSLVFFLPAVYGEGSGQLIQQQVNHQQEQEKAHYNQLKTQDKEVRASESDVQSGRLDRLMYYRNARQKTSLGFQVLRNNSHYYLNDTEIYNQERLVTHLITRLSQRRYMGQSVADATVSYQRNAS